jgi:hypothetical protein
MVLFIGTFRRRDVGKVGDDAGAVGRLAELVVKRS